jgi:hypothetical protein
LLRAALDDMCTDGVEHVVAEAWQRFVSAQSSLQPQGCATPSLSSSSDINRLRVLRRSAGRVCDSQYLKVMLGADLQSKRKRVLGNIPMPVLGLEPFPALLAVGNGVVLRHFHDPLGRHLHGATIAEAERGDFPGDADAV